MAQFNYQSYEAVVSNAQNGSSNEAGGTKIAYFKLNENEEALVRIYISSVDQIQFATVHKPLFGKKFDGLPNPFAGISCYNELGSYAAASCPLCAAAEAKHPVIDRATKKCFIPMLVSHKDAATGQWSAPVASVWERPASFARELVAKLQNYGDLTKVLFKMSRVGTGKDTRYVLDYAVPTVFKPELIPEDFSAFANFQANKSCYWELTKEQINEYLATGTFNIGNAAAPQQATPAAQPAPMAQPTPVMATQPAASVQQPYGAPYQPATPSYQSTAPVYQAPAMPQQAQPAQATAAPEAPRNFNTFKF